MFILRRLEDYRIMPFFAELPVSDPQISPNGKKLLFSYTITNLEKNKYFSHIWILSLDNFQPRQSTYGTCNDSQARWSPDGKSILFLSDQVSEDCDETSTKKQVWRVNANGGEAKCLTSVEEGVQNACWAPDGQSILFKSYVFQGEKATNSDVKIIRRIKYKQDMYGYGFFEGRYVHLFTIPAKGGTAKPVTDGEFDVGAFTCSPNGKQVAFVSNLEENADLNPFFQNIYLVSSKGGAPELLWKGRGMTLDLSWSPDNQYLAFSGRVVEDPNLVLFKNIKLWALPLNEKEPKDLTVNFDRTLERMGPLAVEGLKWSFDSKKVYFVVCDKGSHHLFKAGLEGKVEKVTDGKITVQGFSLSKDGGIAFAATDNITPSEIWLKKNQTIRRITYMNQDLMKKIRLSEPQEFWFKASDRTNIQGWIVTPHSFKKGKKYPTIIEIHGGPYLDYGYRLQAANHEFQVLASHGFAVVYTNPRGSLGYDEKFTAGVSGRWGERDYLDIMEAMDYVIETYPFVDAGKLGVAGGSYGGFMTNWIVSHTNRFKAAISMRSISNQYSFHGTSAIGYRGHDTSLGKDPWDSLQRTMDKSPITYVKNIKTPLLLIHSEEDYSTPMEQAEQLFTALKKLNRVVELVRFPNEGHNLSRSGQPKHRQERLQHILRWFDRYLKEK